MVAKTLFILFLLYICRLLCTAQLCAVLRGRSQGDNETLESCPNMRTNITLLNCYSFSTLEKYMVPTLYPKKFSVTFP